MAHKTVDAAIKTLAKEQEFRDSISCWHKDYERWYDDLIGAIDTSKYELIVPPLMYTKNQLIIAAKPGVYTADALSTFKRWSK